MAELGKIIPLTVEEKELYSKLDFEFFLDRHLEIKNVNSDNIQLIYKGYKNTLTKIKKAKRENAYQNHLFIEGYIRKMHSGGMLANHFNLSEARDFTVLRFEEYGDGWAYFETWAKKEKSKRIRKVIGKRIIEIGALIGYVLAAVKVYNLFIQMKA